MGNPFKKIDPKRIIREVERGINRAKDTATGAITNAKNDAMGGVNWAKDQAINGVTDVENKAKAGVQGVANELEATIKETVHDALEEIEDKAEEAVEEAYSLAKEVGEQAAKLAMGITLQKALEKAKTLERIGETALTDVGFSVGVSVVEMSWEDLGGKIGSIRQTLEHYANNTPDPTVDAIFALVEAFAPSNVSISVDGEFFTNVLSASAGVSLPITTFLEHGRELLNKVL